jgi:predicted flap endonuclease-1-like 5' DNA nuclease
MNDSRSLTCAIGCWLIAGLAALLAFALLLVLGGWSFMQAAFVGVLVLLISGALMMWLFCSALPGPIEQRSEIRKPANRPAPPAATQTDVGTPDDGSNADAVETAPAAVAVASSQLAGQEELASRKGAWTYDADTDGDGQVEGTGEGTKPETLSAARDGKADDLKRIKGIGPKLEKLCNSLGFYHFDQIAAWTADEVAWVDANLEGFKGRVTRDEWVSQAKLLASGGETAFSKKVDKGDVY